METANPTADVTNTGTAQGTDPFGGTVSDSDTATVDVISPGQLYTLHYLRVGYELYIHYVITN
jgi:hypothetical protein